MANPYPSAQFTEKLRELVAHFIWENDMDKFLYVLMYAVSCLVEGHDAPSANPTAGRATSRWAWGLAADHGDAALQKQPVERPRVTPTHKVAV